MTSNYPSEVITAPPFPPIAPADLSAAANHLHHHHDNQQQQAGAPARSDKKVVVSVSQHGLSKVPLLTRPLSADSAVVHVPVLPVPAPIATPVVIPTSPAAAKDDGSTRARLKKMLEARKQAVKDAKESK